MRIQLDRRNMKIFVVVAVLLIIVGAFVGVRNYKENASQLALSQIAQETKIKADQEAQAKVDQEAKAKVDQEAKAKADQEVKSQADQEAKAQADQEAKAKADQEAKVKADQDAKAKADQVAKASTVVGTTTSSLKTPVVQKGFKNSIFANSSQVFLVTANGMSTSYGTGRMYEKTNGQWNEISEFPVRLGSNGMSYTRVQNSNKTPAGVLNIISAFGVAGNPGLHYVYHNVTVNDYWDLNNGSPNYNRMVSRAVGGEFEHLIDYQTTYKYALVTDWNYSQNPNKGGAIFIHVNGAGATGSCISLPEGDMVSLMKWMNPNKNPKILVVPNSDLGNYFY